jgi:ATP-binding cassette subfamily G (WHITE) protein 2 (PDR)
MTYSSFSSSIAEMALARAAICAWDNSTRGLDSATALEFVKALRMNSDTAGSCNAVAIYQASQPIYDTFDKAIVLYEGRQIYFGPASHAKDYFLRMGWDCPLRQTTGDFLTSITNPSERQARAGMDAKVPRTSAEFETYWLASPEFASLKVEIERHRTVHSSKTDLAKSEFQISKGQQQAKGAGASSPYLLSVTMQVKLCVKRAYQRYHTTLFVIPLHELQFHFLKCHWQNVE